jgi:hypothetical protein
VILVRVGEDHQVDPTIPGRNVRIELDEQPIRVGPAVHQQAAAAVALDQDRVALPDIEHGQMDAAVRSVRDKEDEGHKRRRDAASEQPRGPGYTEPLGVAAHRGVCRCRARGRRARRPRARSAPGRPP